MVGDVDPLVGAVESDRRVGDGGHQAGLSSRGVVLIAPVHRRTERPLVECLAAGGLAEAPVADGAVGLDGVIVGVRCDAGQRADLAARHGAVEDRHLVDPAIEVVACRDAAADAHVGVAGRVDRLTLARADTLQGAVYPEADVVDVGVDPIVLPRGSYMVPLAVGDVRGADLVAAIDFHADGARRPVRVLHPEVPLLPGLILAPGDDRAVAVVRGLDPRAHRAGVGAGDALVAGRLDVVAGAVERDRGVLGPRGGGPRGAAGLAEDGVAVVGTVGRRAEGPLVERPVPGGLAQAPVADGGGGLHRLEVGVGREAGEGADGAAVHGLVVDPHLVDVAVEEAAAHDPAADADVGVARGVDRLALHGAAALELPVHPQAGVIDVRAAVVRPGHGRVVPQAVGHVRGAHVVAAVDLDADGADGAVVVLDAEGPLLPAAVLAPGDDGLVVHGGGLDPGAHRAGVGAGDALVAQGVRQVVVAVEQEGPVGAGRGRRGIGDPDGWVAGGLKLGVLTADGVDGVRAGRPLLEAPLVHHAGLGRRGHQPDAEQCHEP